MKALNLHAIGDLRYEEVPVPVRKDDEVLLKVHACGICGSDIPRIFKKGTYHFPTIPGHEFSGEIVEAEDKSLIGKRAAVFPLIPCGRCASDEIGDYCHCENYDYYGSRRDGAYAEYLAVKTWNLIFFDESLSYEEAAVCEPAAVALHTINRAEVKIGDKVAIFGAGPIGVMLAMWARLSGAGKVMLCDIDQTKVDFAKGLGFDAVNSRENDPVEWVNSLTDGRGADVCIEAAGVSSTIEQSLKAAKAKGRIVFMGNPAGDVNLTQNGYWAILRKELEIKGTWNSCYNGEQNDWKVALKAIETHQIDVRPLITHRFHLDEAEKAFSTMMNHTEFFSKVMFVND